MDLTCCSRDDAKNLFIACIYGGNEYGWLRRMAITEHELSKKVCDFIGAYRKCAHNIRQRALQNCDDTLLAVFGKDDPDQLWHQILVRYEDQALQCIEGCMADHHCRVAQLSYDGCFWEPPIDQVSTWTEDNNAALELAVNARLARLPGLLHHKLKFKIKGFQLPKVCGIMDTMRKRILELEKMNEDLRK